MNLFNLLKPNKQTVTPIQIDYNGEIDPEKSLELADKTTPLTLSERLFGRTLTKDIQNVNNETGEAQLETIARHRNGLLNDIGAGARENFNTGFAANNLNDNFTSDGLRKGFGYRFGEGLGSVGRVLESPLGRGLLTAAAVGFAGGNPGEMLAYGLQGGSLNQQLRNADKLYKQQLKDNYGFTDEQLNNTRGYIRPDTFNNLTKSQNSAMSLALRQQTTQSMNNLRALQAEKLRIMNSTLPEIQKAKLLQENAKAAHAEEMQLARINYYNNAIANPLGWANYGLKLEEQNRKNKETDAEIDATNKMLDGGSTPPAMPSGTTKSGNKWKEVN